MIALIDGQLYEMSPLTRVGGDFSLRLDKEGDMEAYIGETRIEYGVFFRSFNKCLEIHPITGKITVNYPGVATIRGIFNNTHVDMKVRGNASPPKEKAPA